MKVVLIDDSTLVRERLAKMLSFIPTLSVVGEAGNSFEAMEAVQKERPHAVVLDIKMPGHSGVEILKKIKTANPEIVIIILTNYPFTQYKAKCFEYGADYFFDKSEEYSKVIDVLEEKAANKSLKTIEESWYM